MVHLLQDMGVQGNMLKFIDNFMNNRKFKVSIGNHLSEWHEQENGVPQGSVLSVTLFLVAINDITKNKVGDVKMIGYADDWYIIKRHKNMN